MKTCKKIMCITHWDLDGVVSYLILRWTFPNTQIEYLPTTVQNFRNEFVKWLSTHNLQDYETVYIMDLGIFEDKDLIDYKNVFIIDHHPGHDKTTYKNAKCAIKTYSSACMLAYQIFKKLYNLKITKEQLYLIALANDFDSYKLNDENSAKLNIIFWDTNYKFESFEKNFINGFKGFNYQQQNILKLHDIRLQTIRDSITVYAGKIKIQNKERYVCAAFATQYINEVADILLSDYKAEIALIINNETKHVSYRRSRTSDVDLSLLANKLAGGAGHEFSSGSNITEKFIDFTLLLKQI